MSRTVLGRVVKRRPGHLTIMLERGNTIEVPIGNTSLRLGHKCNVSINNSNGKVLKVMDYDEDNIYGGKPLPDPIKLPSAVEQDSVFEHYDPEEREESILGGQKSDEEGALEWEDLEYLEWESSRGQSFES